MHKALPCLSDAKEHFQLVYLVEHCLEVPDFSLTFVAPGLVGHRHGPAGVAGLPQPGALPGVFAADPVQVGALPCGTLVERFDIEPYSDFSAK